MAWVLSPESGDRPNDAARKAGHGDKSGYVVERAEVRRMAETLLPRRTSFMGASAGAESDELDCVIVVPKYTLGLFNSSLLTLPNDRAETTTTTEYLYAEVATM
ncbi:MAG: hypothetical protein AB1644_06080 [Candidatus Zixiibacteriota bacterium]